MRDDDGSGQPLPQLASSWETSPNADVYTFTLRSETGMDFGSYVDLLNADPPQIWRLSLCGGQRDVYGYLAEFIGCLNGFFGAWDAAAYEAFLVQAARTADPGQRKPFYKFAEEILVEGEAVLLPIDYGALGMATAPTLTRTYGGGGYSGYVADWRVGWRLFLPLVTSADQ